MLGSPNLQSHFHLHIDCCVKHCNLNVCVFVYVNCVCVCGGGGYVYVYVHNLTCFLSSNFSST